LSAVETEMITVQIEIGKIDTKDTEVQEILETDGQEETSGGHNATVFTNRAIKPGPGHRALAEAGKPLLKE
jgi:hypothetical protein